MNNHTLVLGIGNTLLSDEGTGIHMLDYLRDHFPDLPCVEYLDGGTLSFTLAAWIEDATNLIVVDAAELLAAPGTVQVFRGEDMDRFAGKTKRSVHEVSLGDLLLDRASDRNTSGKPGPDRHTTGDNRVGFQPERCRGEGLAGRRAAGGGPDHAVADRKNRTGRVHVANETRLDSRSGAG